MSTLLRTVTGANDDPLAEAIDLTKRLKLPHIRRSLTDIIPTAKAQRWDPAEVVRVLLAEEAAGRDRAKLHTRRKRAGFATDTRRCAGKRKRRALRVTDHRGLAQPAQRCELVDIGCEVAKRLAGLWCRHPQSWAVERDETHVEFLKCARAETE